MQERSPETSITREGAAEVLRIVDRGLISGAGKKPIPGQVCVEQAVCIGLGLPFSDNPECVAPALRSLKIRLNDSSWSSKTARARGLRRLVLAQLGSKNHLDEKEFRSRVVDLALRKSVPAALRSAASVIKDEKHKAALCEAANRCEKKGTRQAALDARAIARAAAADAAYAAAYAAADAAAYAAADAAAYAAADAAAAAGYAKKNARDKSLADYAECVVQILIEMGAPGCQWLSLTEAA